MATNHHTKRKSFFPRFGLLTLRGQAGLEWRGLVDRVNTLPVDDPEVLAFRLTIDRVRRTQGGEPHHCRDPFCTACLAQVVAGFDGDERDLMALYQSNLAEVNFALRSMRKRALARQVLEQVA